MHEKDLHTKFRFLVAKEISEIPIRKLQEVY